MKGLNTIERPRKIKITDLETANNDTIQSTSREMK